MENDFQTLLYPFACGDESSEKYKKVLFLNARNHEFLRRFEHIDVQQFFKPYADDLLAGGFLLTRYSDLPQGQYDLVMILLPKNIIEAKGLIAAAAVFGKSGGAILCAADNKAGGARLPKMFRELGLNVSGDWSKNKARVVRTEISAVRGEEIRAAINNVGEVEIAGGLFFSVPGIFGWDKIDRGSELLLTALPQQIDGRGADFGCGYGYLSLSLLQKYPDIQEMNCIDADERAVSMCSKNCAPYVSKCKFLQEDLSVPLRDLKVLDFIIMNPPFHEGKKADADIGGAFIRNAAKSLKRGGVLYMVANRHLPYENILREQFSSVRIVNDADGFKVFIANF